MNRKSGQFYLLALLVFILFSMVAGDVMGAEAGLKKPEKDVVDIIGITHVAGRYYFGEKNFLNEGAERILKLGSRVIKVWFSDVERSYRWNCQWPECKSLVETAKTPYFRELFDKPFNTYVLMVFSKGREGGYFREGMSERQKLDEQKQFYELTRYLLNKYQGTDKTFVLQHWEGDWLIRGNYDSNAEPTETAIEGMKDWLNARQAGVNQARKEFTDTGVNVFHAAEVNLVVESMRENQSNVVNRVLPGTNVDLVSYSAWDSTTAAIGNVEVFKEALDYIAKCAPDSERFGSRNVYVGEFGVPANDFPEEKVRRCISDTTEAALAWDCPYVIYWQLYCNEASKKVSERDAAKNEKVRGFWLVRPDGTYTWQWDYLHGLLKGIN